MEMVAQNMEAHLVILRGEIKQESETLGNLLIEKKQVEATLNERVAIAVSQAKAAKADLEQFLDAKENAEQELLILVSDIEEAQKNVDRNREAVEKLHRDNQDSLARTVIKSQEDVMEAQSQLKELREEINEQCEEYNRVSERLAYDSDKLDSLQYDLAQVATDYYAELDRKMELQRSIDSLRSELYSLQKATQAESVKIAEAYAGLTQKELELDNRDKNFAILKGRFAKAFALLYPDQNIDNLI
jgi:chromosome segregation ATPase